VDDGEGEIGKMMIEDEEKKKESVKVGEILKLERSFCVKDVVDDCNKNITSRIVQGMKITEDLINLCV
jgi:hypothetical protein